MEDFVVLIPLRLVKQSIFCLSVLSLCPFFLLHSTIRSVLDRIPWCLPETAVTKHTCWKDWHPPSSWFQHVEYAKIGTRQLKDKINWSNNNMQMYSFFFSSPKLMLNLIIYVTVFNGVVFEYAWLSFYAVSLLDKLLLSFLLTDKLCNWLCRRWRLQRFKG